MVRKLTSSCSLMTPEAAGLDGKASIFKTWKNCFFKLICTLDLYIAVPELGKDPRTQGHPLMMLPLTCPLYIPAFQAAF